MYNKVPLEELDSRLQRFKKAMDTSNPEWEFAVFFSKVNLYYFTGTMQDGMLMVQKNGETVFWVRKSFERASQESMFPNIKQMNSYRDAAQTYEKLPETIYLETETIPLAMYQRFQKYFNFKNFKSLESQISYVRSIKSPYEISIMKKCGEIHRRVLEELVPNMLREGMSESDLFSELYMTMMKEGHQGDIRYGMFDTYMALGQLSFGRNSIYPTSFNGPGGNLGMNPSSPMLGNRESILQKGDLVFIDVACVYEGYHTDKTMTYMFGAPLDQEAILKHKKCVEVQNEVVSMLRPGIKPADIYNKIINSLEPEFLSNFMGYGNSRVKFIGHAIGLVVDEQPVIAEGFYEPLQEGMTFAIEPKYGIQEIGMVGIENTFLVTTNGGLPLTGTNPGLIPVY
jgi:Xaa-Pro dipeptidase